MHNSYECISVASLEAQIEQASAHELTHMLLEGAKTHISAAQVAVHKNKPGEKGKHLDRAIQILGALKSALDFEQGGEIAENLDKLYDYIQGVLLKASLHKSTELLIHANYLLSNIDDAWQAIKYEV